MITLPTLPTAVSADTSVELSAVSNNLTASDAMPPAFLTLLGNRLLTLAQQSGTDAGATAKLPGQQSREEKSLPASELSTLLAALDKPEALNALLQSEKSKVQPESADDHQQLKPAELTDGDKQALQALFAMLPPTPAQPDFTAANPDDASSTGIDNETDGSKQHGLNALLSSLTRNSTPAQTSMDTRSSLSASSFFQQALSSIKQEQSTESQPTSLPTVAPLSAASTPLTPTASASVMAPATPQLNSQLGSPEWQQALSQQVVMFNRNGQQNAELRLHPQDLGSIQISLKLDNDQAQLNMVSGHSQVRAALEAAIPQLRTALAESGIYLAQSNVSSDASAQSHSFSGQQQSGGNASGNSGRTRDNDGEITPIAVPATLQARAIGNNAVDIFA
ncbi:flagellar hook-length control protein FliK [Winslowiella toletana]|uniref:flagellar hook-length control protein FliK n=1 Tax=Winslowiella toletana TaxID=92490 RepID=UPI0028BF3273|nr:flagellar hook-length control protein FliK [Winslowiella toletana]WNN42854.1 flagellar hook-length control protein FliK [Winslowiella toletana]